MNQKDELILTDYAKARIFDAEEQSILMGKNYQELIGRISHMFDVNMREIKSIEEFLERIAPEGYEAPAEKTED